MVAHRMTGLLAGAAAVLVGVGCDNVTQTPTELSPQITTDAMKNAQGH